MSAIEVRPFRRSDRDQLTRLVNAHAQAVVPGMSVSVHAVLSQLERQPGEFITDPWVSERATLVAQQGGRVAAAHLLRYFADERAGTDYRGLGEICWFLFWPEAPAGNPGWPDATWGADELMAACLRQFARWGVTHQEAGGELPVPGVYGVPAPWPHVSSAYERAGFAHTGHTEIVYLARVSDLPAPAPAPAPVAGLSVRRSVGMNGTRLSAVLDDDVIGYIEVETGQDAERQPRHGGWADIGNLRVEPGYRRRGVATWLLGQAAGWLRLADVDRVLDYAWLEGTDPGGLDYADYRAFLPAAGFRELTRTRRGWARTTQNTPAGRKEHHGQH
ncbi:MAG: GNAT family N-acetyltransferase [Actinomycetota bacterium]|nr:GNAT family N-acetyltransferase [Actinomycetota bacterium]